ncbi:MAG: UvrD-helicase domain-containing protein [Candidatus Hydrogenedentales bacterium]
MMQLNPDQRRAVTAPDGPALVLAGAGSGKTRVIVERIVHLVQDRGVDPRNILAVTFTNRAAQEMMGRVTARLEMTRFAAWVGTFHAFGLYVLRRDADKLGRSKSFTIFDDGDQLALMKRLVRDLPKEYAPVTPREALNWVSSYKQDVDAPDLSAQVQDFEERTYRLLWQQYHEALARASAVDFDDLLVLTARLLEQNEEVGERYRRRFKHILVDEYQDTNRAQYRLARALAGPGGNLFAVGDEDQAIYSWRGADIRNILQFQEDFPGAQVYRLEQNYRSTDAILAVANGVVAHNTHRLGKTLWTDKSGGAKVTWYQARDEADEATFIVDTIVKNGLAPKDVAILFRTNGQTRALEEALRRKGLGYVVLGGVKFYGRKEVKDVLSYLRLIVNPPDDEALRRVLNVPPRGIGATTFEKIEQLATRRRTPLIEALRDAETEGGLIPAKPQQAVAEFLTLLDDLAMMSRDAGVAELVTTLLERIGYREYVEKSDEKDFRNRLDIVDEFVNACAEFDERKGEGLDVFLQELALQTDVDKWDEGAPVVTLLTCHSAKGLEFEHVFLAGLEEGLLPHSSAFDEEAEMEEERRLCYVAITRARQTLTLTSAESRLLYGERQPREVSRFVGEMPRDRIQVVRTDVDEQPVIRPPAQTADTGKLKTGVRVRHARFGAGRVMYTSGSGARLKVRIRFDTGMSRQFMASAAPLEILEGKSR